ncbi:hypothetical protein BDFB_011336 [Asbolus verrucosus]|uniref:Uncharacterized protein n=1 Tax=Asbolus verrucosus TaxID=1661398 RepID=A0A482V418_ASBVE|nr:hypothetical protein BDFB_011336 [Asbolus verrucosus]
MEVNFRIAEESPDILITFIDDKRVIMNPFAVIFAICCLATAQARPGFDHGGGSQQLQGVPDLSHYGKLTYPKFDVIDLGGGVKDSLPPAVVEITKTVSIKEPQPYPVKFPVPVPHPVPVAKPYPVVQTKIVKIPQPFPVEVIKKVPVPIEVPKPFPVPSHEGSFGGSFAGHGQLGYQKLDEASSGDEGGYGGGFEGAAHAGGYAEADQSGAYGTQVQAQQVGWVPIAMVQQGGYSSEQAEEQH